jgi:hypothetical protein
MRLRTAAITSLVAVAAAGTLTPALAAPKAKPKPITKTYTATAPTPDPTPILGDICTPTLPSARHSEPFKVPAAGRLKVDIEFTGDWALGLRDKKSGSQIASSDGADPFADESMDVKFKRPTEIFIDACNFAGGSTATVTYTFTYA